MNDLNQFSPAHKRLGTQLKVLLERAYGEKVDRIPRISVDESGNPSGLFTVGRKLVEFSFKNNQLSYKLSKASRADTEDDSIREDAKKQNKCVKGVPCKGVCIPATSSCNRELSEVSTPSELSRLRQSAIAFKLEKNAVEKSSEPALVENDYVNNPETGQEYTIRELKEVARQKQVYRYSEMDKAQLRAAIKATDDNPEQQERVGRTLLRERGLGSRAIKASGVTGQPKRNVQDANRTWKNLNAIAKFADSAPVGWGAAAIGAFLLGTTIRSYERAKGEYRSHFKEAAEEAQEKAANLGSANDGLIKRTPKNNITFVISPHKGDGTSEEIQKHIEKLSTSPDKGDQWLANSQFFVPFNLKETGAKPGGSDTENAVNALTDYVQNFRRKKDQDAVDLAAQIYAYGIQRTQDTNKVRNLKSLEGRHNTLIKQSARLEETIKNLEAGVEKATGAQKILRQTKLENATRQFAKTKKEIAENRDRARKVEARPDTGKRDLANKGKNINILTHSRSGQTAKTAMEYLARMNLPGEPSGKDILEQVNLVMCGTPHFGFTENVTKRQRTLISAQDPVSMLPVFGEGARQQWISSVKGHGFKDYLDDPRAREAMRESFGYYQDSLLERRRRERKNDAVRTDKNAVCKVGKPCKSKSGKVVCIPKSHECASDDPKAAAGKTPFYQDKNFQRNLAIAGVTTGGVAIALGGAVALIKHDLKKSSVDFNSIRQPPGGVPDEETYKKYDSFQPGDLIRKNFKSDNMGTRQHYAVYVGKAPNPNNPGEMVHWCIDTGENWKHRDKVPHVTARGLTWNSGPNDSEYEKVPASEMGLVAGTQKFTPEEIVERAEKMLYQRFTYEGFESNCEAFARAIVEGKAYSAQGSKVSPLTSFVSKVVTDNVLKIRTNQNQILKEWETQLKELETKGLKDSPEAQKLQQDIADNKRQQERFGIRDENTLFTLQGMEVTGLTEYATDKYKMNAKQIAEYLERERVYKERRQWESQVNPYSGGYEQGYLGTRASLSEQKISEEHRAKNRTNLEAKSLFKVPFKPFNVTLRLHRNDSVLDTFFDTIGLRSPEDFNKAVETIAAQFPKTSNLIKIELYKNYLMMFFGILTQDTGERNDSYVEAYSITRIDDANRCSKGKPCKTASGSIVCIPKSSKCRQGEKDGEKVTPNQKEVAKFAIAGASLSLGAAAAIHVGSAISVRSSKNSVPVVSSEEMNGIRIDRSKPKITDGVTGKAQFVKDESGKEFVFKEVKNPIALMQASSDVVASDMGRRAGVNVNQTRMVPASIKHPLKEGLFGATLHDLVPGKPLDDIEGEFRGMSLSQNHGLLTPVGITPGLVKNIAKHPDLPRIAALDTFTGNWDRGRSNLFYDEKTNSFNGIDMGVSYSHFPFKSLASASLQSIEKIDVAKLSSQELQGLQSYRDTLNRLHSDNSPGDILKKYATCIELENGNWNVLKRYISYQSIRDNHKATGKLIKALDAKLQARSDAYWEELNSVRLDKGKKCGEGYISSKKECLIGKTSPGNNNKLIAGATAGAAGLLVGGVALHLAFKYQGNGIDQISPNQDSLIFSKNERLDMSLNGIEFKESDPDYYVGVADNTSFKEPDFPKGTKEKKAGVVVVEPDGRLWVYEPKDHYAGTKNTFSKGGVEEGLSIQQNALKEAREELGLQVKIVDHLGDFGHSSGKKYSPNMDGSKEAVNRYYMAVRTGGAPWEAGWEADKVKLVSPDTARKLFNRDRDKTILEKAGEYTTNEASRSRLVSAFVKNEAEQESLKNWKPTMTSDKASEWNKTSVYKETLYHATSSPGAKGIKGTGFNVGIRKIGKAYGRGVYLGVGRKDVEPYFEEQKRMTGGGEVLPIKVNVKKVLDVPGILKEHNISDTWLSNNSGGRGASLKQLELAAKKINSHDDYLKAVERFKAQKIELEKQYKNKQISKAEFEARISDNPEGEAFSQIAQRAGYDAMRLQGGRANISMMVVFDPKKIVVLDDKGRTDSYWEARLSVLLDGDGEKCGKGYISPEKKCKLNEGDAAKIAAGFGGAAIAAGAVAGVAALTRNREASRVPSLEDRVDAASFELKELKEKELAAKEAYEQEANESNLSNYKCAFLDRKTKQDEVFNLKFNIDAKKHSNNSPKSQPEHQGRKVFISRHGEREDQSNPLFKPAVRYNSPLSSNGENQAKELATHLKGKGINEIYASPFLRTMQTANAVATELNVPIKVEYGMAEWHNPKWFDSKPQPMSLKDLKKQFPLVDETYDSAIKPSYPETSDDVIKRSHETVNSVVNRTKGNVLFVGHGATVIGGTKGLTKDSPEVLPQYAGTSEIENKNGSWKLNDIWHPTANKKPPECRGAKTDSVDKFNCKQGKPCKTKSGKTICIPKSSECASDRLNKKAALAAGTAAIALGAGIGVGSLLAKKAVERGSSVTGLPVVEYLNARKRYREGFENSARMAEEMSKTVPAEKLPDSVENISFIASGFYGWSGLGNNDREKVLKGEDYFQSKLAKLMGDSHHVIAHRNTDFTLEKRKETDWDSVYNNQLMETLKKGHNSEAVKLSAEVMAWREKNPDKPISLVGHSAGGMITHEAAEILAKRDIPVKVVNLASPWFGITKKVGESHTIVEETDWFFSQSGNLARDEVSVKTAEPATSSSGKKISSHSLKAYMSSTEVQQKLKDLLSSSRNDSYMAAKLSVMDAFGKNPKCVTGKPCQTKSGGTICIPKSHECANQKEGVNPKKENAKNAAIIGAAAGAALVGGIAIKQAFFTDIKIARRQEDEIFDKTPQKGRALNEIPLAATDPTSYLKTPDNKDFVEPPFPKGTKVKKAGVVVLEPDGRFWIMEPANHVGGVHNFAKGTNEEGLSNQQNALKEAKEELGLDVKIVDHLGDFGDSSGKRYTPSSDGSKEPIARYFIGVRTGGAPWDAHWEADKVKLVSSDTARQLFRKGKDRRELSVIEKAADYTSDEPTRMKMANAYIQAEKDAKVRESWKPSMTKEEAEKWAKDSAFKDTLYHGTRDTSAESIEKEGFRTDIKLWGAYHGRGVYSGRDVSDVEQYVKKHGDRGAILELKANVKNVLFIDKAIDKAVKDPDEKKSLYVHWKPEKMRYIAKHLNFEEDFHQAVEREKRRKNELTRQLKDGRITQERYNSLVSDKPESEAFTQLLQRAGYDAMTYHDNEFADKKEFLVFDRQKVTVMGRAKYNRDAYEEARESVLREDKRCGNSYIPNNAICRQGQGRKVARRRQSQGGDLTPWVAGGTILAAAALGTAAGVAGNHAVTSAQSAARDRAAAEEALKKAEEERKKVEEERQKAEDERRKAEQNAVSEKNQKRKRLIDEVASSVIETGVTAAIAGAAGGVPAAITAGAIAGSVAASKSIAGLTLAESVGEKTAMSTLRSVEAIEAANKERRSKRKKTTSLQSVINANK